MKDEPSLGSDAREEIMLADAGRRRPAFRPADDYGKARAIVYSDFVKLKTPKDEKFIEALKGVFRWHEREWKPEDTAWLVHGTDNIENAIGLLQMFFPDAIIDRGNNNDETV